MRRHGIELSHTHMERVLNGEILRRELFGEGKRESDGGVAGVEKGMSGLKVNEDN
jgi:hypothetical protein